MISIHNLSVQYGTVRALKDVSINIQEKESIVITGPSGCGKSTLALALCGLIPRSIPAQLEGQIEIDGMDPLTLSTPEIAQHVGIVFQRPATQLFHLRIDQEVAFGSRNLGLSEDEVKERTEWALNATGIQKLRDCRPDEISGGQKQCVAIASVLAMRPRILILDEPTSSLDIPNSHLVMETLRTLQQQQALTIILIEHRLAEVIQIASRVIVMDHGTVFADGNPENIFTEKEVFRQFGIRRPALQTSLAWEDLVIPTDTPQTVESPLLTLEGVSAGYHRQAVIRDINLQVFPSDFVALVGDNGVGKSTLGLVAAGLLKPLAGRVRFDHGKRPRPGLDVSMLFQNPEDQLLCDSVEDEVAFAPHNFGQSDPALIERILQETDLTVLRERRPNLLSVGQQQRTTLAACLSIFPRLMILDEPTLGQDWGHLQRMMTYLTDLNRQGIAILLISHDYKLIHRFAKRLVIMKDGRIFKTGQVESFLNEREPHFDKKGAVYEIDNA